MDNVAIWDVIALGPIINISHGLSTIIILQFRFDHIVLTIIIRAVMFSEPAANEAHQGDAGLHPSLPNCKKNTPKTVKNGTGTNALYTESGVTLPAVCYRCCYRCRYG